jgi:iron-sulfur cluster assembly accessory protein
MSNIHVTDQAFQRVKSQRADKKSDLLYLRVTVEGGGCSGFQYKLSWDEVKADDHIFGESIITDSISLPFLDGATVDYSVGLMGEDFKVTNPNAKSGCGCGTSFAV